MKLVELMVSNLHIGEDEYSYKGLFSLSCNGISIQVDLSDLDGSEKITEIKKVFELEESPEDIRKAIMNLVIAQSSLSSPTTEGEHYSEGKGKKKSDQSANSLDIA